MQRVVVVPDSEKLNFRFDFRVVKHTQESLLRFASENELSLICFCFLDGRRVQSRGLLFSLSSCTVDSRYLKR